MTPSLYLWPLRLGPNKLGIPLVLVILQAANEVIANLQLKIEKKKRPWPVGAGTSAIDLSSDSSSSEEEEEEDEEKGDRWRRWSCVRLPTCLPLCLFVCLHYVCIYHVPDMCLAALFLGIFHALRY